MPATVADPKRSLDSEQISPATIAHHTAYEKIPSFHQSHICQRGAQPYLVGPLSRLVGKPPLSPWLSKNILPLTKSANDPNSAISLTQTFDRILFCVYNCLYFVFWGTKRIKRGSGNNRLYRNLNSCCTMSTTDKTCFEVLTIHVRLTPEPNTKSLIRRGIGPVEINNEIR